LIRLSDNTSYSGFKERSEYFDGGYHTCSRALDDGDSLRGSNERVFFVLGTLVSGFQGVSCGEYLSFEGGA
jgi:hypothetical protein